MYFANKVIWITGASSGIGEELAIQLSKSGASLVLSSRRQEELIKVRGKCGLSPEKCMVLPLDMTDSGIFFEAVRKVTEKFGKIDILINNAGISQRSLIIDTSEDVYRRIMEINFFGVINLTRNILPNMIKNGGGQIVIISSVVGRFGFPMRSGYSASKHALHGFLETMRIEMKNKNISICMVLPGRINTNISVNAVVADGSSYGIMDEGQKTGIPVNKACRKIIKAIRQNKPEVVIGRGEKFLLLMKRCCPAIFFRVSSKIKPT